ncbi:MAG: TIGR00730 family Rossman fold protein [Waddliaceae bacterium]|jgi:uncharacterized protein (TIGR00730 family)|nr:TIGR00730 family Rossman fold protein [Waddliaceae bacterium]MBT3579265.1 TIGR00730 family Rossman fold protein [Waddliaceae bacterium]MBT4444590.1 TIGR00730 family Rossman fold protein [Waddliaceae bacterium]MBT6928466.1 TIGR00730 family Rossman fold protein [Waddliaceae bacterium]MBT7264112.1 TIGR00730 family Rossman fold protein [Waddliaceae bacterium]
MVENKPLHKEFKNITPSDSWRVFRILSEFVDGFETLTDLGPSVTIFGSARMTDDNPYYSVATDVAEKIASRGFSVITGGGPGVMEAANKGAQLAKGSSCGIGIDVPYESDLNRYVDPKHRLIFRYFFVRKVMFVRYAQAFVFLPGGFGTLDELFEVLTLIQTNKIMHVPIYLIGKEYWEKFGEWLKENPVAHGLVDAENLDLYTITDDLDEVAEGIEAHYNASTTTETLEF